MDRNSAQSGPLGELVAGRDRVNKINPWWRATTTASCAAHDSISWEHNGGF